MVSTAEKARAQRLERLRGMIDGSLDNPAAALETLMLELKQGESQPELWEGLHAAAARNGKEPELSAAYRQVATGYRSKQLPKPTQAEVLMHAADFHTGVMGDVETANTFLMAVLDLVPGHSEAYERLERRFEGDKPKLIELYAAVAESPPKTAEQLANTALNLIVPLTAKTPLSDEVCRRLVAFAPSTPAILDALEAHCLKTNRAPLACALREAALGRGELPAAVVAQQRRRLIELYIDVAGTPAEAMPHVEALLERDAADAQARAAAERLLRTREVASRAATVLNEARRQARAKS